MPSSYVSKINLAEIKAIDIHTHVEIDTHGHLALDSELMDASAKYFKVGPTHSRTPSIKEIAELYRSLSMAAVIFTVDAQTATGHQPLANEEIAEAAAANADVLIPFGSVDPWKDDAVKKMRALVENYGVKGFKFHPSLQAFTPNERKFYPIYEVLQELGVVALFHTGQTGIGAGLPGGRGIKLGYSNPILLDDVAADFPELQIVLAHPSVPWVDTAISMATHKANVFRDLSGWHPKYFPQQLVAQAGNLLKDKLLFGTDFPLIAPERWLTSFESLDISPESKTKILKTNAASLLKLS